MMKTVLGIDLGTQSLKIVFYDYEARRVAAEASSPLDLDRDKHGKAEQDAHWWLDAMQACFSNIEPELKASVQAIAVSGQQHGFVAIDKSGEVLAPVKLWCDTATMQEVQEITANCGGRAAAITLSGNPILAGYTAPKIRWLRNKHPELYARMAHILLPHDYLNYVLTGQVAMEYGDASGTGLLDVRNRQWSEAMLRAVDEQRNLHDALPALVAADQWLGVTSTSFALALGLAAGIPVATGGGDNMMAAIGTGNVRPGELTLSLGSSGTAYAYSDQPVIDPDGNIAAFCSSTGGWLPLLCTMNCTLATEQMRQTLGISISDFDALTQSISPGSDGLLTLPFFNGERTPNLPTATASMLGLNAHNCTSAHMLRSTMEGASYSLKFGLDELNRLGLGARQITLTGGGSKSLVWRQIIADVFQLPVRIPIGAEGACFGAALQALWVMQRQASQDLTISSVCSEHLHFDAEQTVQPDPTNKPVYEKAYKAYQRALTHISPLFTESE